MNNETSATKYRVVSLFCGAGGLDLGFDQAGFQTIWANDINQDACNTHKQWSHATVVCKDIKLIDVNTIPDCDVVIGGFPCQGFSLAGPRKIDDKRNILYKFFVNVVESKKPKAFVAENVKGILTLGGGEIIKAIISDFASRGYKVQAKLLNASDYGVPQDRFRVILVGIRNDIPKEWTYPEPLQDKVTLRDVLSHLPEPLPYEICDAPYSSRFMSRNRRRDWNEQSFTIPAMAKQCPLHPSSPAMNKLGPDHWEFGKGSTRRLSWREAAAIQTFPSTVEFQGNLTSIYQQIGNAVPVNLARAVATQLKHLLDK